MRRRVAVTVLTVGLALGGSGCDGWVIGGPFFDGGLWKLELDGQGDGNPDVIEPIGPDNTSRQIATQCATLKRLYGADVFYFDGKGGEIARGCIRRKHP